MQLKREQISSTKVKLIITADKVELDRVKQHVLKDLGKNAKVPGFRQGKAPSNLVEKQIDPNVFQSEFVEHAVNDLYVAAVEQTGIRPVAQPQISLSKFVPFTTLEFSAEVEAIGEIKLPDYKKIKLERSKVTVTADEIKTVLNNLRQRAAKKSTVQRAAKNGDEVVIDFSGVDAKTKKPIEGTEGSQYPLTLGSDSFIPGFEDKLIGLRAGDQKAFDIVFPKDYGVQDLQNRKVTFTVKVHSVSEPELPKLDDDFAKTVGPFKTLTELKADIKKGLTAEKQREADQTFDNQLLEKIAAKTTVEIPASLIEEEIDRLEDEEKRNIVYRGQTWQEHLDGEGLSAEEHREKQRDTASLRVKTGLILGEISQAENISVSPEELEVQIQLLKGRYTDQAMQDELDKPESRRDLHSRLMTQKTLDKLRNHNTKT